MPRSIPKVLNRDHIHKALADVDVGIDHPFGKSTGYDLVHNGKRYVLMAVLGVAFRHLTGDGLGFEVLFFDEVNDSERVMMLMTTKTSEYSPFFVTSNEMRCSEAMMRQYRLRRLFCDSQQPPPYVVHGALSDLCRVEPVSYRATVTSKEAPHDG